MGNKEGKVGAFDAELEIEDEGKKGGWPLGEAPSI